MLLSREIQGRLEEDRQFLQKSAVQLVRYLTREDGYNLGVDEIAAKLKVPGRKLLGWLSGKPPSIAECWKIVITADEYLVPIEWVVRGEVLDKYNLKKRIPLYQSFIEKAVARLQKEGKNDDDGILSLNLIAENGTLSFFEIGSWPGKSRIWLNLRILGEDLSYSYQRISIEDEGALGGLVGNQLPKDPVALNKTTLPAYDRHYDHSYTIADLNELARWVEEGEVVGKEYITAAWERG